ncbi:MAG: ferritin-like domain-containing protein, partial [Chloroflexota bacterium]|nr:ferritin-like domain-containing protein [Chloroflexota bacterium]
MRALHEQILDAVAEERQRLGSRRRFLGTGAKIAGGGALLGAFAAVPGSRALGVSAQDFADDIEVLNFALALERLEATFYADGLESLGEEAFADIDVSAFCGDANRGHGNDPDGEDEDNPGRGDGQRREGNGNGGANASAQVSANIYARFEEIRDHERAHVDALVQTITDLGGEPVEEVEYDFGDAFVDITVFIEVAASLENVGVAAYAGAALFIQDESVLAAAVSIQTVEARHAGYLNLLLGDSPFPDAFDEPMSEADVL